MKGLEKTVEIRDLDIKPLIKVEYHQPEITVFGDVQKLTATSLPFTFIDNNLLNLTSG